MVQIFERQGNPSIYKVWCMWVLPIYPRKLLKKARTFAGRYIDITNDKKKVLYQATKTILFSNGKPQGVPQNCSCLHGLCYFFAFCDAGMKV